MVISIDWLQLHCSGICNFSDKLQVERQQYSTRQFKHIDEVYIQGLHFATVVHTPLSSILDPLMVLIKVQNQTLYRYSFIDSLKWLISDLGLSIVGISRLDICNDFDKFHNNQTPHNLIRKFMSCKYRKVGQTKYKIHGEQKKNHEIDYLRFGTNNSLCAAYLYNKTKEMNEVKMKTYISDMWVSRGLVSDSDIWRLEFSLKGNQIKFTDVDNGVLHMVDLDSLADSLFLEKMYFGLLNQYFTFRIDKGEKNVTRMKQVILFKSSNVAFERFIVRNLGDGTRADKIFIKKMEQFNSSMRGINEDLADAGENYLTTVINEKGLDDYYLNKISGNVSQRVQRLKKSQDRFVFEQIQMKDKFLKSLYEGKRIRDNFYNK